LKLLDASVKLTQYTVSIKQSDSRSAKQPKARKSCCYFEYHGQSPSVLYLDEYLADHTQAQD
jgi:hypothetical protein